MNDISNVTARIAYDDLREWLADHRKSAPAH